MYHILGEEKKSIADAPPVHTHGAWQLRVKATASARLGQKKDDDIYYVHVVM